MTQLIKRVGRNDLRLISRESLLILMLAFFFIIVAVFRFGVPALDGYLAQQGILPNEQLDARLSDYYPMLVAYMMIFTAGSLLSGTIFGFLLLDEKDFNTIKAILVTPVPMQQYLLYRIGMPTALSFFFIIAAVLGFNQALISLWQLVLIAAGGSLTAAILTLFYAIFAENKVQGFAYSKFVSISGWVFLLGWFVPEPWQWLLGLFPPFWIGKAYWLAYEGRPIWWVALLIGIVTQVILINWLLKRFHQVAYRA